MYLPLAAVVVLAVLSLHAVPGERGLLCSKVRRGRPALGSMTVRRNQDYKSAVSIWRQTVAQVPGSARAHLHLASALAAEPGHTDEAIAEYAHVLRLLPGLAEAHGNLASLLARDPTRRSDAIAHYEEALRLRPGYADGHYNLAESARVGIRGASIRPLPTAMRH